MDHPVARSLHVAFDWIDVLGLLLSAFGIAMIEVALGARTVLVLPGILVFPLVRRAIGKGPVRRTVKRGVSFAGIVSMLLMTLGLFTGAAMTAALFIQVQARDHRSTETSTSRGEGLERREKIRTIAVVGSGGVLMLALGGLLDRWRVRRNSA